MQKTHSIQIYLKPDIEEEAILLDVWNICRRRSRPQFVFRRMLQEGLRSLIAQGELPNSIAREIENHSLLATDYNFERIPERRTRESPFKKPLSDKDTKTENVAPDVDKKTQDPSDNSSYTTKQSQTNQMGPEFADAGDDHKNEPFNNQAIEPNEEEESDSQSGTDDITTHQSFETQEDNSYQQEDISNPPQKKRRLHKIM